MNDIILKYEISMQWCPHFIIESSRFLLRYLLHKLKIKFVARLRTLFYVDTGKGGSRPNVL